MTQSVDQRRKSGLGRGLSALFGDSEGFVHTSAPSSSTGVHKVPIDHLQPGPYQPRRHFDDDMLTQLAGSIKQQGILQPIVVRRHKKTPQRYEIIAGERRWRAAQKAGLHDVPVVIRDFDDRTALEVALIENLQRQDLSPLEEAEGYQRLMEEFQHTQEALSKALGKSRSHIANMVRLLALPDPVKSLVQAGDLSAGHARALLMAKDPVALARQVVGRHLNVRQTENMVRQKAEAGASLKKTTPVRDADIVALERQLQDRLGVRVSVTTTPQGAGTLTLHYKNLDEFEALMERLVDE